MNEASLKKKIKEGKKEIPFSDIDFQMEDEASLKKVCRGYNVWILQERQTIKISKEIDKEDFNKLTARLKISIGLNEFFQDTYYSFINNEESFNIYKGEIEAVWKTQNKQYDWNGRRLEFKNCDSKPSLKDKRSNEVNQIILNRMFAGSYIDDDETIGHETINTIIADNGNCYIYLNSEGTINQERTEYSGKNSVMLLVKLYQTNVWEIIGVVKDIHTIEEMVITDDNRCWPRWYRYDRFIEHYGRNVTYGGVPLERIQENNRYNNVLTRDPFATCTGTLYNLREPYFIVNIYQNDSFDNSKYYCKVKKGLSNQSLRMFFDKNDSNSEPLFELINDRAFNDNLVKSTNRVDLSNTTDYINESIFDVLGIQYYELAYSNIISHYLCNNEYCKAFIRDVLELEEDYYNDNYKVVREEHNVDILLKGKSHIIVIENKIKSDINGRNITKDKIIKDIFGNEEINDLRQELTEEPVGDHRISQLCKYWYYAQYVAAKNEIDENNIKGFVLIPNYQTALITESSIQKEFKGDMYQLINYRKLYDMSKNMNGDVRDLYYDQYLLGLERQSRDTDNYKQAREMNKFINRIKNCINDQNHSSENE